MKKYLLIASVFIPFATTVLIVYFLINFKNNVKFSGLISDISIKNILNSKIDIVLILLIDNNSTTTLTAKNVSAIISYKNEVIATTKLDDIKIVKNQVTDLTIPASIFIDDNTAELVSLYKTKQPINLDVKIKAYLFRFIPINYDTNFTYTQ